MMKKLRFAQTGDTLVEVMLALAALSALLGTSYATAARAQKISQLNQDRAEATKIAESQLELLRNHRDQKADPKVPTNGTPETVTEIKGGSGKWCFNTASGILEDANTPGKCNYGTNDIFHVELTYDDTTNKSFAATTTWVGPRGEADNVTLWFRMN